MRPYFIFSVGVDLCFWGLPVTLTWSFNKAQPYDYIVLYVLCFSFICSWRDRR